MMQDFLYFHRYFRLDKKFLLQILDFIFGGETRLEKTEIPFICSFTV